MLILQNVTLIDGTGQSPMSCVSVMVRGDRIAEVTQAPVHGGAGDWCLDLTGCWLMPGLIDAHTHLGSDQSLDRPANAGRFQTYDYARHREEALRWGITTVRSGGDFSPDVFAVRRMAEAGELRSPRILAAGRVLQARNGHPGWSVYFGRQEILEHVCQVLDPDSDVEEAVRRLAAEGADWIKAFVSDDNVTAYPAKVPRLSLEQLRRIVNEAHRLGLPVMMHVDDLADLSDALEAGADTIACSSTGNAASSLAGNAAAAGLSTYIFVPSRAPRGKVAQLRIFGATVISVEGSYEDTFELSRVAIDRWGWYNRNAAINPYLSEGKKTVTLEILEQLGWCVPDYIALSVGDGCTIAGAWKGLKDLYAAGFIDRLPRLISVQAEGCCPLNRAIETGKPWEPMAENTLADSIAVGVPRNPDKALSAIRESDGVAVNVSDGEILEAMRLLGRTQGVFGEPAGAAGTAGVKKAVELGLIPAGSTVVSIVTGNGLKDVQSGIQAAGEPMRVSPDMDALLAAFAAQDIRP